MKRLFLRQIFPPCAAILFVAAAIAHAQKPTAVRERVEEALQAVAAGQPIPPDAEFVPVLIEIVDRGEHQEADLAIRALAQMKSASAPAVAALCTKLGDPRHHTRSVAIDALVAIGDDAVGPLHDVLKSTSPRARGAATVALRRLKRIRLDDLDPLAADPDPRVRAAVAVALGELGRPAVNRLAPMLKDVEVAVAIEAARALRVNRSDPAVAVPALAEAAGRADLCASAVPALSAYGIEARSAVPEIIAAYDCVATGPDLQGEYSSYEVVEALRHIGPPDESDLARLIPFLTSENDEVQILTAKVLSLMGERGRAAAPEIVNAIDVTLERHRKEFAPLKEKRRHIWISEGGVYSELAELAAALWHVTKDARRFVHAVQWIVVSTNQPIEFSRADPSEILSSPAPWKEFSAEDVTAIEQLFNSSNRQLILTALDGVSKIGPRAEPLLERVIALADGVDVELDRKVFVAIGGIGPSVTEKVEPVLVSKWRDSQISLLEFASVARQLKLRSDAVQRILTDGLANLDQSRSLACAEALCATTDRPDETAALIIATARRGCLSDLDAIQLLRQLPTADDAIVPYLADKVSSYDFNIRINAIRVLGAVGMAMRTAQKVVNPSALNALQSAFSDEDPSIRFQAAVSLYQISGGQTSRVTGFLMEHLRTSMSTGAFREFRVSAAFNTIAEFGPSGAPFLGLVIDDVNSAEPGPSYDMVNALQSIGSPESTAELKKLAESSDYERRTFARAALRKLQTRNAKGDR